MTRQDSSSIKKKVLYKTDRV